MNYVILNGKDSRSINGLMIQELPPITKPMIRYEREEIDGRDGDILTKLGFSAYEREISIGLYGEYDVDEVIEFFNSSGKAIFSNEPDKYYQYEIVDQIDFERLCRWKKATVAFHVQPFKYSAVDDAINVATMFLDPENVKYRENSIFVTVQDGDIGLFGIASAHTNLFIPVQNCDLLPGDYTLTIKSSGSGRSYCRVRLTNNNPNDLKIFGNEYVNLDANTKTIQATITEQTEYKYIWVFIPSGTAIDAHITADLKRDDLDSITLLNRGNTASKPSITIYATGTVTISLNGTIIFTITMGSAEYVTIDPAEMNAYCGETLMNRSVVGDYENLILPVGKNTISWTGSVTNIIVRDYTRWI